MGEAINIAIGILLDPLSLLLILLGVLLGMLMGILPGLGGTVTLALLIPLTYSLDPLVAFMILTAALGGTNFGGSITSILLNTPGTATSAATLLDGYPMTQQGRAGEAIGASAAASALGAVFGVIILVATIPVMRETVLLFGPPEVFWLGLWGLTVIAVVVRGRTVTGLISAGFGLIFAMFGVNNLTATYRWTYGTTFLIDGVKLVPALIGLFAVAEMISLISEGESIAENTKTGKIQGGQWKGVMAVPKHKWIFLRSAVIGAVIGVIPGVGGSAANFVAYFQAVQTTANSEQYGTGDIRGVVAAEAANDAKDGAGFIPTLGLGIPGSAAMAVLLGAFVLHGIQPGPLLLQENLDIVMVIVFSLLISNMLTSSIGLLLANQLVRVTKVDIYILGPSVIAIAFLGTFTLNNNVFDLLITAFFGVFGLAMINANISRVPLILGLVLGPIVESNFFRSLEIGSGNPTVFFSSGISLLLIVLVVISLIFPLMRPYLNERFELMGGVE